MGSSFLKKSHWQPRGQVCGRDGFIERAFLRLGDILADIAHDSTKKEADIEDTPRGKDTIGTSQQTLADGEVQKSHVKEEAPRLG